MVSPHPFVPGEGNHWSLLFRRPSQESKQSPVSWGFFTSLPVTYLWLGHRHTWYYGPPVFYLWPMTEIQNSKFLMAWQGVDRLPSPSLLVRPAPPCPRKVVAQFVHRGWSLLQSSAKSCNQVIRHLCSIQSPSPFCPRKAVAQRLGSIVARLSAVCLCRESALCSVLSQKSSCLACMWWFKSIVAHSEKLLQGYLPSGHTPVPAV